MKKPSTPIMSVEALRAHAFDCVNEAVMITDAESNILDINPAFIRMTGYAADEVRGRNPRLLASGKTSPETYDAMRRSLAIEGHWQGEIWDRRKDGRTYPKWLSVTALYDAEGNTSHYIGSFTDISSSKDAVERMYYMAHHDPLTGLANRTALDSRMELVLSASRRTGIPFALMLIDMDNFKQVNDTLGHAVGDQLLIRIADRLRDNVRASDTVARLGGDEFVVILADIDSTQSVAAVASKLTRALAEPYELERHLLYSTPSIGVCIHPDDGGDPDTLLKHADSAMYHAKAQGRNNFQFFTPTMNAAAHERLRFETALRHALEQTTLQIAPQFSLHFQPQVDIASGRITGLEALARWHHPELGHIPPTIFIQIAEETGLIRPLGDWIFWEACRKLRDFKAGGLRDLRVAVNLSTQQLRHEQLPVVIRGALACYDLEPWDLELEITESTAMQNPEATIRILEQLKDMGIVLAIDDFGTGYSSLSYLKHLPIHRLKLDRSFVKDIESDTNDAAICSATIVLGHNLGLDLVAEGVETVAQRDYLHSIGCDLLQGFLCSKPLPADEVVAFVTEWNRRIGA